MKKYLWLLMLMTYVVFAGEITWLKTYKQGIDAAQKEHKPILLFIYKPGCGACEFMEEEVFTDKMVYAYINDAFIPVKVNINTYKVPKDLETYATPTFQFIDAKGKKLRETLLGGKTGKYFVDILKEAVDNYKKEEKL